VSRRDYWNARYAGAELVWGEGPNRFVAEALGRLEPQGRALDLACGEGRNALWLAERGWRTTAVDFSPVALERARELARRGRLEVEFIEADATRWEPPVGAFALVVVAYLHLPPEERRLVWSRAARALGPGGLLFLVGHAARNLAEGVGGPQQAEVLWEPAALAAEIVAEGLEIEVVEEVTRPFEGADRDAIDVRLIARRPPVTAARS
jgi:SAM-dependent methyltransferase